VVLEKHANCVVAIPSQNYWIHAILVFGIKNFVTIDLNLINIIECARLFGFS
jgi:hypothetical protein